MHGWDAHHRHNNSREGRLAMGLLEVALDGGTTLVEATGSAAGLL